MEDAFPDEALPYVALFRQHLGGVYSDHLYVGEHLHAANFAGVEETYGPFLKQYPREGIVALYDRSFLGWGRAGFLVTDRHLHYAQAKSRGSIALDHVRRGMRSLQECSSRPDSSRWNKASSSFA